MDIYIYFFFHLLVPLAGEPKHLFPPLNPIHYLHNRTFWLFRIHNLSFSCAIVIQPLEVAAKINVNVSYFCAAHTTYGCISCEDSLWPFLEWEHKLLLTLWGALVFFHIAWVSSRKPQRAQSWGWRRGRRPGTISKCLSDAETQRSERRRVALIPKQEILEAATQPYDWFVAFIIIKTHQATRIVNYATHPYCNTNKHLINTVN